MPSSSGPFSSIGLALLCTLIGGRGQLIGMGVVALIAAGAVGIGAGQHTGPVGDTFVAPTMREWPVSQRISAGTVTNDLTRHPLPEAGTATIEVGAGRIVLTLPAEDSRLAINARITAGTVRVDGEKVADGVDVQWSRPATAGARIPLHLQAGLDDIEVNMSRHDTGGAGRARIRVVLRACRVPGPRHTVCTTMRGVADVITFRPDDDARRALAVLTSDGTTVSSAVRSALLEAARQRTRTSLRAEAEQLASDPDDRAEAALVLRDMETLRAW